MKITGSQSCNPWHRPQHLSQIPINFHITSHRQGKTKNSAETDPKHHKQADLLANKHQNTPKGHCNISTMWLPTTILQVFKNLKKTYPFLAFFLNNWSDSACVKTLNGNLVLSLLFKFSHTSYMTGKTKTLWRSLLESFKAGELHQLEFSPYCCHTNETNRKEAD